MTIGMIFAASKLMKHEDTKYSRLKNFIVIFAQEEKIATKVVDSAFTVHKRLSPGLLEHVNEICFCHELKKRGLTFRRQVEVPVVYDNLKFQTGFRVDVIVENLLICELKSVLEMNPVFEAQILSY